jgi:hypothetical protein
MVSANVTLYTLQLGAFDPVTGWPAKSYVASTIKMPIFPKGTAPMAPGVGKYVRYDAVGFCVVKPVEGDVVLSARGTYWRVSQVEPYDVGDVNVYYLVGLTHSYLVPSVESIVVPPGGGGGDWFGYACVVEGLSGYAADLVGVSGYARNQTGTGL